MKSARDKFFYADDDGLLVGMRQGDYKYVYAEQRLPGTLGVWAEPFTRLRLQKIFNLFQDPYERADITSNTFWDWQLNHVGQVYGAMDEVFKFAATFKDFPPRSFPPSFVPTTIRKRQSRTLRRREGGPRKYRRSNRSKNPIREVVTSAARNNKDSVGNCLDLWRLLAFYERAIETSKKALHQDPSQFGAPIALACTYAQLGRKDEAQHYVDELLRQIPRFSLRALRKNPMYVAPALIEKLVDGMPLAGLPE